MAWFGWKPGREGARPVLSRVLGGSVRSMPGEWPQGYEAQVRSGYCRNAVAQRAVKLLAESVGGAPLRDVPGVTVEEGEGCVRLSGAELHARRVEDARLRDVAGWLR